MEGDTGLFLPARGGGFASSKARSNFIKDHLPGNKIRPTIRNFAKMIIENKQVGNARNANFRNTNLVNERVQAAIDKIRHERRAH